MEDQLTLTEDQWLLKVRTDNSHPTPEYRKTGFLTKLTQKGQIPKAFDGWGKYPVVLPTKIHTEDYAFDWWFLGYRRGCSQDWAIVLHPKGFTLEMHLNKFIAMLPEIVIENGELLGQFKWTRDGIKKKPTE